MKPVAVLLPSLATVLLAALVGQAAAAEEETARVLRFRRIFVPAERAPDWPAGADKYLPLDAAEFERWRPPHPRRRAAASVPAAAITAARYEAKLVGDHLAGQAALDVVSGRRGTGAVAAGTVQSGLGTGGLGRRGAGW